MEDEQLRNPSNSVPILIDDNVVLVPKEESTYELKLKKFNLSVNTNYTLMVGIRTAGT